MLFTKCPVCGSELADDMIVCEKCGWTSDKIDSEEAAVETLQEACPSDSEAKAEKDAEAAAPKKSFRKKKTAPRSINGKSGGAFYGFLKKLFAHRHRKKEFVAELKLARGSTKIKYRILMLCVISVVFVVIVLEAYAVISTDKSYESSYRTQAESLTTAYLQTLRTKIESMSLELEAARSNSLMLTVIDEKLLMGTRKQKLSEICNTTMFKDLNLATADGITYSETDISEREYFKRAMEGINTLSSPLIRMTNNDSQALKNEVVMLLAMRYKNALFDGVICGAIEPSFFSKGLDSISGGNVVVLDKDGVVVASSDLALVTNMVSYKENEDPGLVKLSEAMLTGETGSIRYNSGGINYIAAYCPIETTNDWTIAVSLDYSPVNAQVFQTFLVSLLIGTALIIGDILIGIKISNRISRPIALAAERLRMLSEGDISTDFTVDAPKDETKVLHESLERTINELGKYINDIKQVLAAIAEGDLTARSSIEYKGDFEAIGNSLSQITSSLNESVSAVKMSVDNIRSGSAQVAAGSQNLSDTAAHTASAVDEIMSIISEIKNKADGTAAISRTVMSLTQEANQSTIDGARLMKDLAAAIKNINEKSEAIGSIIKTIDDIALQTNILAINASIEAARVGEAGRGFAVVASEVGALANKSAEAVRRTAQLVNGSIEAVEDGTAIALKAENAIMEIARDIDGVAGQMSRIVEAANEQTLAVKQITESMSRIDAGMHTTTATAEQSAASSSELSDLAVSLSGKVDRFKTE